MALKIGITGQDGFVGRHLFNYLGLQPDIERVHFEKSFFENKAILEGFVASCDVIVHLAAMNRHEDPQVIYDANVALVSKLVAACEAKNVKPHVLFSSSTQEDKDNHYGRSKAKGGQILSDWSERSGAKVTSLIIPNVFGPFGRPFYNSVVATFCHQLANGETPTINMDGNLQLIYVNELVEAIYVAILESRTGKLSVSHTKEIKVSELLALLVSYKTDYFENGVFPNLDHAFEKALFNTFRCYVPENHYPFFLKKHTDARGSFVEIARANTSGQFSFSTTHPGITRGNHFHTRKAERFAVIKGKALIQLRKVDSDQVINYYLDGKNPSFVDMPIWYTHNIKNIGTEELLTLFWINEPYNAYDPDTYFVNV